MFRWMLPQRDLWIVYGHTLVLDGCFYRWTFSCMWTPWTTIQMNTEAERLAEEPEWCFCLLWMPQQIDLLLHMDTIRTSWLFAMDASTDGLVVAHRYCCYVICTRLLVKAPVKTVKEMCYICVCDARQTNSVCDILLKCIYVNMYLLCSCMVNHFETSSIWVNRGL